MSPDPFTNQLLVGILLAIIGHAITVLVKSPKEAIKELAVEVGKLRDAQTDNTEQLARHDERWVAHDKTSDRLANSLRELTSRIDKLELMGNRNGRRGGG